MGRLRTILIIISMVCLPYLSHAGVQAAPPEVILEPKEIGPGDLMMVTVNNVTGTVEGMFNGKKVYFNPSKDSFKAIIGVDLGAEPGTYTLDISSHGATLQRAVNVIKKEYALQRLTLPKEMVELTPENEARVEREQRKMAAIWPKERGRLWAGDFINPLEGEIVTGFGVRRIINNTPKSPHSGVDVSGDEGEKIRAPNNGMAVLLDNQFFSGETLVLDHGQGIYTMFFHLSKILVKHGQEVKKGEAIALVGSTGRATGPHLHWGVRVQGARVDPLELVRLKLE